MATPVGPGEVEGLAALQQELNRHLEQRRAVLYMLGPLPPKRRTRRERLGLKVWSLRTALARRIAPWLDDY